ncbi:MAG TPA: M81 family metallopeptidase [Terriglobia bacterium]|nr:M81 family metallopeptidase [Terriglobia bacterium]
MRIAFACVMQESNSFAPAPSVLEDFDLEFDSSIVSAYRGTNTEVGGFLSELERFGAEPAPLISAFALASGPIRDEAFDSLSRLLSERVADCRCDGLLMALHGAWLGESHASADAELMRRVRSAVGPDTPVVASLDFHANVRPSLLAEVDAVVGYRTYPHVDMAETGQKAARLLHEMIARGIRPRAYWLPIPLLAPPQRATTDLPPLRETMASLDQEFGAEAVLSASFFCVQPWLDVRDVSSSLVVIARSADDEIPLRMRKIAGELWNRRDEFEVDWVDPHDLVRRALENDRRPVIVSEAFDGTTGGGPGDNPGLLSVLLPHQGEISACLFIVDAEAVSQARQIGLGGKFCDLLGAKKDRRFGPPIRVEGRVIHLSDGGFVLKGPVFTGKKAEMGPTAVLEIGRLKVVVGSQPVTMVDPELYRSQGIEPGDQTLVAVKSPTLFRPGYASMLGEVFHLDMPGVCPGNLKKAPFSKIKRPIYPLDDFAWKAG